MTRRLSIISLAKPSFAARAFTPHSAVARDVVRHRAVLVLCILLMGVQALAPGTFRLASNAGFDVASLWCGAPPMRDAHAKRGDDHRAGSRPADYPRMHGLYQNLADALGLSTITGQAFGDGPYNGPQNGAGCSFCLLAAAVLIAPPLIDGAPALFASSQIVYAPRRDGRGWYDRTGPPLGARSPPIA